MKNIHFQPFCKNLLIKLNKFIKVKAPTFFIFAALLLGLLFNMLTPPLQAPDELNHFYRAYQIADGHFLPEKKDNRLGGQIPICFNEFVLPYTFANFNLKYTFTKKDILNSFNIKFSAKETEFKDFPNTSYYSPISYLPQSLAIYILKQFECSVASLYYGGRLFSFLFWLLLVYLAIRLIPIYKWLITVLALLPMHLYIASSFSADTVTNCLAFLTVATSFRYIYLKKVITYNRVLLVLLLLISLALAKLVYVSLGILFVLVSVKNFKNNSFRYATLLVIFAAVFISTFLWSNLIMTYYIKYSDYNPNHNYNVGLSPCGDYHAQKVYILNHGLYFLKVIYHSLFNHPQTYLTSYIGVFGQSDTFMPNWTYMLSYIIIVFLAVTERNFIVLTLSQKSIVFLTVLVSLSLLLLSQHLLWDCVGEGVVDILQGRYLIPIFPLFLMLISNKNYQLKYSPILVVLALTIFLNSFALKTIFNRFFKESFSQTTSFYCDAEIVNNDEFFRTTNPSIKLEGGHAQTKFEKKSGNYSMLLSPVSPYGFSFKQKLKIGDLIEMEAWKKGGEGALVLSGKGINGENYFISNTQIGMKNKTEWVKIHCVITITQEFDSSGVTLFAWNSSKENIYFDDFKFSLKQYSDDYLKN